MVECISTSTPSGHTSGRAVLLNHTAAEGMVWWDRVSMAAHSCTSSDKGTDAIMEAPPFIPFWPSLSPESHPLDTLSKNLGAHVLLGSTFTQGQTIIPLYSFFLPSMAQPPSNGRALHFCEHPGASVQGEISRFVLFPISCSASLGYNSWPLSERH